MRVIITKFIPVGASEYLATMSVGGRMLQDKIVENLFCGHLRSLGFGGNVFPHVLEACGLKERFGKDFWSFHDQASPQPPWDYGEHDDDCVNRVLDIYRRRAERQGKSGVG
jgi:hypothetical protein